MGRPAERVVAFYNKRGMCEQWITEGKSAIKWTRLSCNSNFMHTLQSRQFLADAGDAREQIKDWSVTDKLITSGAKS
jgi:hypothetical protein